MQKFFFLILLLISICNIHAKIPQDTIISSLYKAIEKKDLYESGKEKKIIEIKKMLEMPSITLEQKYDINLKLYNEYKTYLSDSAIHYCKENVVIAEHINNKTWISESKLDLVSLYIIAGMYIESLKLLESINPKDLPKWLLIKYYDGYKQLYKYYSNNNPYTLAHNDESELYRDSLLSILDQNSNHYKIVYAEKLYDENKLEKSEKILQELFDQTESDTHEKAVLAYALANIYKKERNIEKQKQYYAISAICDIKNAIKENASMQALASVLYETGDVEKAYQCIRLSMEDAMFCNARLRTYEVSQIFPIIDSAYQENVEKQKSELKVFLSLVSLMSVFLIIAIVYIGK